ncbi:deoxyribose-phosphate aldolase [Collinsella sp. AGMB00827]|uniref:Deoxyribose-phosphate aldolase n=1 Tax=Collinsella ureilytica TaxID=2869515 RepID=A0ABS7MIK7_9ACTN|nr:deoxyribose-phosphate aldolase [Collinsella urealyticum]MBY4797199.1 deoxyribose-phosphate aldolase [Collinsella urealyticum]
MSIASVIDHTLLKPEATRDQIVQLCTEAITHGFASVCVNSCWVSEVSERLVATDVRTCTVIGFPLGAASTHAKAAEATYAVQDGADELDMVINIGWLRSGDYDAVRDDIAAVVEAAQGRCVKVILETCLLSDEEIRIAGKLAVDAGASFVKTSTGFSSGGATVETVALMAQSVAGRCQVKASGGIHTAAEAKAMIEAGATRIGTSSGVAIVEG